MHIHIQMVDAFQPSLMLETCHTARCVGGSGDTNMELLALLVRDPVGRVLKATTLVVLV